MNHLTQIPEIQGLDARQQLIRIPDQLDVPITPRIQRLLDTAEFRRLARITQLGLVSLVYPAAHHSRFEHSLGVYRMALLYLKQLSHDPRFAELIGVADAERLMVASLLHDIGHWPFCHPLEDLRLPDVPTHEQFAARFLEQGQVAETLRTLWRIEPADIVSLLKSRSPDPRSRVLGSILSGPIDVDKMDYLARDSLHAGVPYGRNFDQQRLIGSLCLNEAGDGLAITEKGRTAAEMMVFARYVMFSEVYWHHAVRAATAMLQRAFFILHARLDLGELLRLTEQPLIEHLRRVAGSEPVAELLEGLFGPERRLYKRSVQCSYFQNQELYLRLARQPYPWLVHCSQELAAGLARRLATPIAEHEVLFDAPPQQREVEFQVEIFFPKENCYRQLADVSPVVSTLARQQFDDYVKRVRLYVAPRLRELLRDVPEAAVIEAIHVAVDATEEVLMDRRPGA